MGPIRDVFSNVLLYEELIMFLVFLVVFPIILIGLQLYYTSEGEDFKWLMAFLATCESLLVYWVYRLVIFLSQVMEMGPVNEFLVESFLIIAPIIIIILFVIGFLVLIVVLWATSSDGDWGEFISALVMLIVFLLVHLFIFSFIYDL